MAKFKGAGYNNYAALDLPETFLGVPIYWKVVSDPTIRTVRLSAHILPGYLNPLCVSDGHIGTKLIVAYNVVTSGLEVQKFIENKAQEIIDEAELALDLLNYANTYYHNLT